MSFNQLIELRDVILNVLFASTVGGSFIYIFLYFGEKNTIDENIFPTVSERQKKAFGFLGFYLLTLTALEILNPKSFKNFIGDNITFKPGFLGSKVLNSIGGGVTIQDAISLILLMILILWFAQNSKSFSNRVKHITQRRNQDIGSVDMNEFNDRAKDLKFAFNFSAVSFLIAIISPAFIGGFFEKLAFNMIIGIFLVSGVYCFIEAMKIGSTFAIKGRWPVWKWISINIILKGIILYVLIASIGFMIYTVLPDLLALQGDAEQSSKKVLTTLPGKNQDSKIEKGNNADHASIQGSMNIPRDLHILVKSVTKIIAGVFVLLAAYLIAWGRDGLADRLNKFMIVASIVPLTLPFSRLLADIVSVSHLSIKFEYTYAIFLLILPFFLYLISRHSSVPRRSLSYRSIAHVRNISWAPFEITITNIHHEWGIKSYSNSEELLEDMVGQSARVGKKSLFNLRSKIESKIVTYANFDAIVTDVVTAIRLKEAKKMLGESTYNEYYIIAGICRSTNSYLFIEQENDRFASIAVWEGTPYLKANDRLYNSRKKYVDSIISKSNKRIDNLTYLPANSFFDFFPECIDLAVLSEPFATDIISKLQQREIPYTNINIDTQQEDLWLFNNYDVLLVRNLNDTKFITDLLDCMLSGIMSLKNLRGPAMYEGLLAPRIASALDYQVHQSLDPNSVTRCLNNIEFTDVAIIDHANPRGIPNWQYVKNCFDGLQSAGVIKYLQESDLKIFCGNGSHIAARISEDSLGQYPLNLPIFHVEDAPGRLRDSLQILSEKSIDLRFLFAQRIAAGHGSGFIYLLPKNIESIDQIQGSSDIDAVVKGTIGFVPVLIEDRAGELENLLGLLANFNINIDSCFAFSITHDRAIVLLAMGEVVQSKINSLINLLDDEGYDTSGNFNSWLTVC